MTAAATNGRWDIADIKLRYRLVEIVERAGVQLKRTGSHRWQGLCPFHADRTPSFFVDVDRERFTCFGCKARGDVIDFVRLHEQLNSVAESLRVDHGNNAARSGTAEAANSTDRGRWASVGSVDTRTAARPEHSRRPLSGCVVEKSGRSRVPGRARLAGLGRPRLRPWLRRWSVARGVPAQAWRLAHCRGT